MRTATATLLAIVVTVTGSALTSAAEAPPALSNNPFSRPPSVVVRIDQGVIADDNAAQPLPLHATMIGRTNRLANVAGRILKPGDEYQGYQLVAIHEQYAIFERDGRDITVYVKPLLAEDNE